MILQNLHTHTVCGDGKNTAEEMAQGAIRSGCAALGFSEHSPFPPVGAHDGWSMLPEHVDSYRAEILRLREQYQGQLDIFLGLEQDIDSLPPGLPYDYLIGSVHNLHIAGDKWLPVDESADAFQRYAREYFGGDCLSMAEAYYRLEAEVVKRTGCQIVGHFDLITKFNEGGRLFSEDAPRYRNAALEALDALLEHNVIFEINTGAISRNYRTAPYPAPFLLKAIREKGGRVCITSDSHSAETITCAFPMAAELAMACGFQETWILTGHGFQAVGLEDFLKEAGRIDGSRLLCYTILGKDKNTSRSVVRESVALRATDQ